MKTATSRDLQRQAAACLDSAQNGPVVISRHGQPAVVLLGVEGYDWEDLFYMTSLSFWREIERRRQPGRPRLTHEEVWRGRLDDVGDE
jgi:prevent-host-death family protein